MSFPSFHGLGLGLGLGLGFGVGPGAGVVGVVVAGLVVSVKYDNRINCNQNVRDTCSSTSCR